MGTKSNNGSSTWVGSFGHWNPHIVRSLNDDAPKSEKVEEFKTKYTKGVELLKKVPGTKKLFAGGVPLCPVLLPTLEKMPKDDVRFPKVGGLPNLFNHWLYNYHKRLNAYYEKAGKKKEKVKEPKDQLLGIWPRCGTCHRYMSFIGQFDLTDLWDAIHLLTCTKDKYGHFSYSSVGLGEDLRMSDYWRNTVEWSFWACPDSGMHFYSQQFDAAIWTNRNVVYGEEFKKMMDRDMDSPAPDEQAAAWQTMADDAKRFIDEHKIKPLIKTKEKITGMTLMFDLDLGAMSYKDWKLEEKIEQVMCEHEDIFAYNHSRKFKLFGEPESQQEEARFFGLGNRTDKPYRLSPVLCWDDEEHDFTYQMYADVHRFDGEGRKVMFAKIDGSCT